MFGNTFVVIQVEQTNFCVFLFTSINYINNTITKALNRFIQCTKDTKGMAKTGEEVNNIFEEIEELLKNSEVVCEIT